MKLYKCIKNILQGLYSSIKRFPVTILISASLAAILILISEINPKENYLMKIALVLSIGIPLSLCIKHFFEKRSKKNSYNLIATYIFSALLLFIYYFSLSKDIGIITTTRTIAINLALYLGFLFIPYFPKKDQFEMYVITVLTGFFTTLIYSIVLFLGLSAILFTIDKLLGIIILGKIYYYTWLFVIFIFGVSYFLATVPLKNQIITPKSYPKLLRILILYIVIPLLTAYTIILYIYFGKIIITMVWPSGIVSHLVLWYSIIVTGVLFFITPLRHENSWANKFSKFAPKIILPLLIMMFISIGIRINAYGITERRYYVVILAIWVFCIMLYFSFTKRLRNIIIPTTLSIVMLFSVLGPFSSYSISKISQNNRFEQILLKNNMIKDGNLKISHNMSKEDKLQISSILNYFHRNHSLKNIKYLPKNFKLSDSNSVLGFPLEDDSYASPEIFFTLIKDKSQTPIDIKEYDYLIDITNLNNNKYKKDIENIPLNAVYTNESNSIKINYAGKEIYKKDLSYFIKNLTDKYETPSSQNLISSKDMILIDENEKIKVKFVFSHISGTENQSTKSINVNELNFYLLIKIK
ncbi:DUF4153 domain-containing protein [Clostridium sporogenes]|uniref:DUF4153 domain-containing protein n=1 Tax=Clostridium botulinum TaxID=1491 RepID=A0A6M0T089_CLOBO|nr:DUF4153 domain-containing protein [Clostridium sporogenes]NFA60783.1 DUF4153 domain-containing protein [Clostridium botulinum]NFI72592.1 DUF4153 domain-containing protein [Clostridium sporogenes]NFL72495.1 DUF4153 domain-containing protein [Clostridium sporogenes]NFM23510.1 DUF4153 domain-containing protein [Clostridium sporogenes]NFP62690.1 DUF4153 domain-containing protein [Clostridium sporogenes]